MIEINCLMARKDSDISERNNLGVDTAVWFSESASTSTCYDLFFFLPARWGKRVFLARTPTDSVS